MSQIKKRTLKLPKFQIRRRNRTESEEVKGNVRNKEMQNQFEESLRETKKEEIVIPD